MSHSGPPKRQRNAFFLYVCNILGTHELQVGYKTTKQIVHPLSLLKKGAPVKVPFGPPTECRFEVKNRTSDEPVAEFVFKNKRNQSIALKDSILNSVEFHVNNFTRKITALVTVENKKSLLSLYLTLLNRTENFVHHRSGVHELRGFLINGDGITEQTLIDAGGSVEDFDEFVRFAIESAPVNIYKRFGEAWSEVSQERKGSNKRKVVSLPSDSQPTKKIKLSKSENLCNNEKEELEDEMGLEKAYQDSFCGIAHIPLDSITVCPQMQVKINPFRVEYIKSSMMKRYNPALSVIVVCPVDDSKKMDVSRDKFYVVQKVKCLLAFKKLDATGDFVTKHGHQDRKVLAFVLSSNKAELMQYANLSENLITGQFANKTVAQDILHHFHCLTLKDSSVNALKVVERMGRLCSIRPEDCTAMERICKWSSEGFSTFMNVLGMFESYQTKDVKCAGLALRIAKGLKVNLSNVLLRLLGKCTEKYFVDNHHLVLDKTISLRELGENHQEQVEIDKALKVLSKIANYVPVETIQNLHPGMFDAQMMKNYLGAVYDEKVKNQKAIQLEKYYEFVISNPTKDNFAKPVEFATDDEDWEGGLEGSDIIVYNMNKMIKANVTSIINTVLGSAKEFHAALILFSSEAEHFDILSYLRGQNGSTSMMPNFEIVPLLFNKPIQKNLTKIVENIQFALLFGKFLVLKSPLLMHYSDPVQVVKVVEAICPSQARISFIADAGQDFVQIHNQDLEWSVKYYGAKADIEKFKKRLDSDKTPAISYKKEVDNNSEENSEENFEITEDKFEESQGGASTSTTPMKTAKESLGSFLNTPVKNSSGSSTTTSTNSPLLKSLDDSGFLESPNQPLRSQRSLENEMTQVKSN